MSTPPDQSEPIFDVAEFSSFELFSPDVDSTLWFFKDLLGMIETERSGDSVFLRGWHDPYNHSLKVTQRDHAGMGFAGWRATSKPALDRRVKALKETGRGRGWVDGECGMGDSRYVTSSPALSRLSRAARPKSTPMIGSWVPWPMATGKPSRPVSSISKPSTVGMNPERAMIHCWRWFSPRRPRSQPPPSLY